MSLLLGSFGIGAGWSWIIPLVLAFAAVYTLLPRPRPYPPVLGGLAAGCALLSGGAFLIRTGAVDKEMFLFAAFSGISVIAAANMITQKNPVHAALSFVLVVLGTCGLFLLQGAPFLMAATMIVYAGAIIVTFAFVIMMAKQHGRSDADDRSREPFLSSAAGFFLLGAILYAIPETSLPAGTGAPDPLPAHRWGVSPYSQIRGATLDRAPDLPAENAAYLGRALFTDYLVSVELGGTLLLVATIGSILITARRREANR